MIRLGILGTAHIAKSFFGGTVEGVEIVAIASRNREKAETFGDEFAIPQRFGSYDELLADHSINAVYIPLPPYLHCEYVVRSALAGKHVLVEKPAALTTAELHLMRKACQDNGVLFMEAFMYRFKAIHLSVKDLVASGNIGNIKYVDFNWCFNIGALRRSTFRLKREAGGGALYDLGVYGVDFLHFISGGAPLLKESHTRREEPNGVDMFGHLVLTVGNVIATVTAGYNTDANYYTISGELGSIHVPGSVSGRQVENVMQVHLIDGDRRYEVRFPAENPYHGELRYFGECIMKHEEPATGFDNSLRNIGLIEKALERSIPL